MKRPATPHIEISQGNKDQNENEKILKNFSNFMKQIIDKQNDIFLNGEKNVVKYILAKYLNVPYKELSSIKKISIKINNDYGLLNQFGQFLPQLLLLKLNNSNIITMNNLGTSFTRLVCLQMNKCYLRDLSGIICLQNLKILDLKCNEISDLIELEMSNLKKINLHSNLIADFDNLTFLSGMDELEWLNLDNNPISQNSEYRDQVKKYLPHVKYLDQDDDIVTMYDNDIVAIDDNKEIKAFISSPSKENDKIVQELNKVLDIDTDNKELVNPRVELKEKTYFRHQRCLAHAHQNQSNFNEVNSSKEQKEDKTSSIKFNNSQRMTSNIFKKQITKYQIDANGVINNHSISNANTIANNLLLRSCKDNRLNELNRDRDIETDEHVFEKDNSIVQLLNNTGNVQHKRGNSLNSINKIDKDKFSVSSKPLLQSINVNRHKDKESIQGNGLRSNRAGGKGKILLLKKD